VKKPLFLPGSNPLLRFAIFALLSAALIYLDYRTQQLDAIRSTLNTVIYPLQVIVDFPARAGSWVNEALVNRSSLIERNARLRAENLKLSSQLRTVASLKYENDELQRLLHSARQLNHDYTLGRLLAVSMNRVQQRIIIDKGGRDGIEPGLPVLDGLGLMGEITRVYPYHSEAMLISDTGQSVPVRILRNGLRGIASGVGVSSHLDVLYLPITADIVEGDMLVTSGLGGKYPPNLPVATITQVSTSADSPFAAVEACPLAALDQSRSVLMLKPSVEAATTDSDDE